MATLKYVGAAQSAANDLVNDAYVTSLSAGNMSQATVTSMTNAAFASNVLKSYVDAQDALNATAAYVDAGDATRLHLSQIGATNGVVGLLSTGKVEASRLNVASLQRWPKPFISPSAYQSSAVTTAATEAQLFTVSVADPGFVYKLLVSGVVDGVSSADGQYPMVRVRQGSSTGQLVGRGRGLAEWYLGNAVLTTYTTAGAHTYTVPGGYTNFDIVALGGGGAGNTFFSSVGGAAGSFASASLVLGSTLPNTTATLTATVGAGGVGGAGVASTVTGTGVTTISGAGGAYQASTSDLGLGPGIFTLHGQKYVGGATTTTGTTVGNAPGGGGGGDNNSSGAAGAVWILAYNALTNIAGGPIPILTGDFYLQTPITGATTLYVMAASSGAGNVTISTLRPSLMVVPVPA